MIIIDLLDIYRQIGIDVFDRIKEFNKAKNLGEINQKVEEGFFKFEAGEKIFAYEKLIDIGKNKEADEMMKDFHYNLNSNNYLKKEYKKKIEGVTDVIKMKSKKYSINLKIFSCDSFVSPFD